MANILSWNIILYIKGRIVVEEDGGTLTDMTVLSWQIGLGETLCYRYKSLFSVMNLDLRIKGVTW